MGRRDRKKGKGFLRPHLKGAWVAIEDDMLLSKEEGEEAVELAYRLKPEVVLMDIRLKSEMDGIEAAEAIQHRLNSPVVIYTTSYSDDATLERAKLTQPYGYILKHFEERDLLATIKMALYKRQIDRQMLDQLEWLRVTLNSIGDAVISCNADGLVYFLNPVAEALTGWSTDTALGRPIEEVFRLINENPHQPSENPVPLVLREGHRTLNNRKVLMTKEGLEMPIEASAAAILNNDGWVIGAVLVFHDVTEKRLAEVANQAKIQSLANMIHEMRTPMSSVQSMLDLVLLGNLEADQRKSILTAQSSTHSLVVILNDILNHLL